MEQVDGVELSYASSGRYEGSLVVRARYRGFEGRGEAWVNPDQVSNFAERLATYPLDPASPVTFSAGIGTGPDYITFIGISVYPVGGKGQVMLHIHLASERWDDGQAKCEHQTTITFPTSYELLRRFGRHVELVLDGRVNSAVLEVDVLV